MATSGGVNVTLQASSESATNAANEINKLVSSLSDLASVLPGVGSQIKALAEGCTSLSSSMASLDNVNFENLRSQTERLAEALAPLQGFKTQASGLINALGNADESFASFNSIDSSTFYQLRSNAEMLTQALEPLNSVATKLGATLKALGTIPGTAATLNSLNASVQGLTSSTSQLADGTTGFQQFADNIQQLATAIDPLVQLKGTIGSTINSLSKLGTAVSTLSSADMSQFAASIQNLCTALQPLMTLLSTYGTQLTALATILGSVNSVTSLFNRLTGSTSTNVTKANSSIIKFGKGIKNYSTNVSTAGSITDAFVKKIQGLFGKVVALRFFSSILSKMFDSASSFSENLNLFTVSMGEYADEAMAYAQKVTSAVGLDISEFIRYQGLLQQITTGFGLVSKQSAVISKNLTTLGYDISSYFDIGIDEAMQKLQSGIAGELEPLRRIGYALDEATLQQVAYQNGISKTIRSMTQAEKAQLRYIAIMNQSKNVMGDMARTLATPANSVRILSQQVKLLARSIGNVLIPIVQAVIPYLLMFIKVLTTVFNAIAKFLGFEVSSIDYGSGLSEVSEDADSAADSLGGASDAAKELEKYLAPFDELNVMNSDSGSSGGGGGGSSGGGGAGFDLDLPEYDFLANLSDQLTAGMGTFFEPFKKAWQDLGTAIEYNARQTWGNVKEIIYGVKTAWDEAWDEKGYKVAYSVLNVINSILRLLESVSGQISDVINKTDRVKNIFKTVWDIVDDVNDSISLVLDTMTRVNEKTELTSTLFEVSLSIVQSILDFIDRIVEAFQNAWNDDGAGEKMLTAVAEMLKAIAGLIELAGEEFFKSFSTERMTNNLKLVFDIVTSICNLITNVLVPVLEGVIKFFSPGFGDVVVTIGLIIAGIKVVISVLTTVVSIVDKVKKVIDLFSKVSGFLSKSSGLQTVATKLGEIGAWITKVTGLTTGAAALAAVAIGTIVAVVVFVVAELIKNKDKVVEQWDKLCEGFADLGRQFADIGGQIVDFFAWLFGKIADYVMIGIDIFLLIPTFIWNILTTIFTTIVDTLATIVYAVLDVITGKKPISEAISQAFDTIKQIFKTAIDKIVEAWEGLLKSLEDIWESIKEFFGFAADDSEEAGENIAEGVKDGIDNKKEEPKKAAKNMLIGVDTTAKATMDIHSPSGVAKGWGTNIVEGLKSGLNDNKGSLLSDFKGMFDSIGTNVGTFLSNLPGTFSKGLSKIIPTVSSFGTTLSNTFKTVTGWMSGSFKLPRISLGSGTTTFLGKTLTYPTFSVDWYAQGGFPEMGELFMANESGPELVGRIGSRNAVANTDQIVQAVSAGVASAVASVLSTSRKGSSESGDVVLKVDGQTFARIAIKEINKRQRVYGRTLLEI